MLKGKKRFKLQSIRAIRVLTWAVPLLSAIAAFAVVTYAAQSGFTPVPQGLGLKQPELNSFNRPMNLMQNIKCAAVDATKAFEISEDNLPDECGDLEDEVSGKISSSEGDGWDTAKGAIAAAANLGGGQATATPPIPKCPAVPATTFSEEPSCESFSTGGKFNFEKYQRKRVNACVAVAAYSCKESQITGLDTQVQCIKDEQAALDQQLKTIAQNFNQNVSRFGSEMADLQAQQTKAYQILKGNSANESEGILGLRTEAKKRLLEWEGEIQSVRQGYENVAFQEQWLSAMVRRSRDARVKECMTKTVRDAGASGPQAKCGEFEGVRGTVEYLACRLAEQKRKDGQGYEIQLRREEQRELATKGTGGSTDALALMNAVFYSFPTDATIPEPPSIGPGGTPAAGNIFYTSRFGSAADIDMKFGKKLEFFKIQLTDTMVVSLRDLFMKALTSCYAEADTQLAAEGARYDTKGKLVFNSQKGTPSFGRITVIQNGIGALEQENKKRINQLFFDYKDLINRTRTALTGVSAPLPDSTACEKSSREKQIECLNTNRQEMREFYEGNSPRMAMKILLPGAKNTSGAVIDCQGLGTCITKLQRATEILDTWQNEYRRESNNSTQKYMDSMKQTYGPLCAKASNRVSFINSALGTLGEKRNQSPIRFETVDKSEGKIEKDEQGLPKPPENFGAAICGGGGSDYLKVDANALSELTGEIKENAADAREKKGEASAALNGLNGKDQTCFNEDIENLAEKRLRAQIEALQTNGCGSIEALCTKGRDGSLPQLADAAQNVIQQIDSDAISALSGIDGLCNESETLKKDIEKLNGELVAKREELYGTRAPASDKKKPENPEEQRLETELNQKKAELAGLTETVAGLKADKDAAVADLEDARAGNARPSGRKETLVTAVKEAETAVRWLAKGMEELTKVCSTPAGASTPPTTATGTNVRISEITPDTLSALRVNGVYISANTTCADAYQILGVKNEEKKALRDRQRDALETFTAWESRRGEVAANRARVAGIEKQLAAQEKKKTELESEIASLNIRLGRSSSDKLDPAVAVQIRNAIEKKEEEIAKKTKQLESGGTGEQRSPGVSKCQSLAKDARKTIDAIGKRAAEAQAAGIGR